MKVLGIAPDVWISSAALVEDGQVVAAAAEERFNRQKLSKAFPSQAIDYCLHNEPLLRAERDQDLAEIRALGLDQPPLVPPDYRPEP